MLLFKCWKLYFISITEFIDCQKDDAIWGYKYVGSKGKKRLFKGKGTLRFMKSGHTPTHGYDYGMKSGHCLQKLDPNLKSIEGNFDEKGILNGYAVLDYFDNTRYGFK